MGLINGMLLILAALAVVGTLGELTAMVYRNTDGFTHRPTFRRYRCDGEEFGVCGHDGPHSPDCPQSTPGEKYMRWNRRPFQHGGD